MTGSGGDRDASYVNDEGVFQVIPNKPYALDWDDLPEEFTPEIVRRLTIKNLRKLREDDIDLTTKQRETFNASYEQVIVPMYAALANAVNVGLPRLDQNFAPRIDFGELADRFKSISEAARRATAQSSDSTGLSASELVQVADNINRELAQESSQPPDSAEPSQQTAETIGVLLQLVQAAQEQSAVSKDMRELMAVQTKILNASEARAAREKYFAFFISIVFVATLIVPIYDHFSWKKLMWVVIWTIVVSGLALGIGRGLWMYSARKAAKATSEETDASGGSGKG